MGGEVSTFVCVDLQKDYIGLYRKARVGEIKFKVFLNQAREAGNDTF